jgi:hypothetical protein
MYTVSNQRAFSNGEEDRKTKRKTNRVSGSVDVNALADPPRELSSAIGHGRVVEGQLAVDGDVSGEA